MKGRSWNSQIEHTESPGATGQISDGGSGDSGSSGFFGSRDSNEAPEGSGGGGSGDGGFGNGGGTGDGPEPPNGGDDWHYQAGDPAKYAGENDVNNNITKMDRDIANELDHRLQLEQKETSELSLTTQAESDILWDRADSGDQLAQQTVGYDLAQGAGASSNYIPPPDYPSGLFAADKLAAEEALSENFGLPVTIDTSVKETKNFDHYEYTVKDENGETLALHNGNYYPDGREVDYSYSHTPENLREREANNWLKYLRESQYPDIQEVHTKLEDVNMEVYSQAINDGLSVEEAIKETPAYKSNAKFGFTEIAYEPDVSPYDVRFTLKKPTDGD